MAVSVSVTFAVALAASVVAAVLRWRTEGRAGSGFMPAFKGWFLIPLAVLWLSVPRACGIADLIIEVEQNGYSGGPASFDVVCLL